jgi:hypothetical protein
MRQPDLAATSNGEGISMGAVSFAAAVAYLSEFTPLITTIHGRAFVVVAP